MIYFFAVILFAFIIYGSIKFLLDINQYKKNIHFNMFLMIDEWYKSIGEDDKKLHESVEKIDRMFEKKIHKYSLLHFDEKFIKEYTVKNFSDTPEKEAMATFEELSRTGLTKTRQSLKILSLALNFNFTLENYSFLNYWNMLKGNYHLYNNGLADAQGRKYTIEDISEPYHLLSYYFNRHKN